MGKENLTQVPNKRHRRGADHPLFADGNHQWKGGITMRQGYRLIKKHGHPNADVQGYVKEHRLVMSEFLERPLRDDEIVHHINEDRSDNRIENLELVTRAEHMAIHKTGTTHSQETRKTISKKVRAWYKTHEPKHKFHHWDQAEKDYLSGVCKTLADVANRYGLAAGTVYRKAAKEKWTLKKKERKNV